MGEKDDVSGYFLTNANDCGVVARIILVNKRLIFNYFKNSFELTLLGTLVVRVYIDFSE